MKMSRGVLKALVLGVGSLGLLLQGAVISFNAYQLALKQLFSLSQSQAEDLISLGYVGVQLGLLPGLTYEKIGIRWNLVIGLILSAAGYLLMYSSTYLVPFYSRNYWLMAVYFFIIGLGGVITGLTCVTPNIGNYLARHGGKVMGIMDASFSVGSVLSAVLYASFFINGHTNGDEAKQDISGFFLMMAIFSVVVNILCIITIRRVETSECEEKQALRLSESFQYRALESCDKDESGDGEGEKLEVVSDKSESVCDKNESVSDKNESESANGAADHVNGVQSRDDDNGDLERNKENEKTFPALLKDWDYHFLLWMFTLCTTIQFMIINNITVMAQSLRLESRAAMFPILSSVMVTLSKLVIGFTSDALLPKISRDTLLLVSISAQTLAMVVCTTVPDTFLSLVVLTVFISIGNGAVYCMVPLIVIELFGLVHFGLNWGSTMMIASFATIGIQKGFGALYDHYGYTAVTGERLCYGKTCFQLSLVIASVLSVCGAVFLIVLVQRRKRKETR